MNRITRFLRRHGTQAPRMAIWAALRTGYRREAVRRWVRPWVSPRRPRQWVFVVGCYNSGTTITQSLLAAHPQISTLPWEGSLITSVLPMPEDLGWNRMWSRCPDHMVMPDQSPPADIDRLLRDWAPWWSHGGDTFLEKSITNGTRMEWLDRHLTPAYFISVVRNGYCSTEGMRRKGAPCGAAAASMDTARYPVEWAAQQWVDAVKKISESSSQVAHFRQIRYEDLVADPQGMLGELWQFLGLDVPTVQRANHHIVIDQTTVRFETDTNQASLNRLSPDEIDRITPIIRDWQQQFGYPVLGRTQR